MMSVREEMDNQSRLKKEGLVKEYDLVEGYQLSYWSLKSCIKLFFK